MTLLAKIRTLNKLLQHAAGRAVSFADIAAALRDAIGADVYVVSRRGKLLGSARHSVATNGYIAEVEQSGRFQPADNERLLQVVEPVSNVDADKPYARHVHMVQAATDMPFAAVIPIVGAGQRTGTLIVLKEGEPFGDDDHILAEYGSTIIAMEIMRGRADEAEVETRSRTAVAVAVGSLSFSELEAVEHIFEQLGGKEGLLVASKIADKVGITRSVIVNALRKLESAGVIESRSLGMKGTYIKIMNEQLMQELDKSKKT